MSPARGLGRAGRALDGFDAPHDAPEGLPRIPSRPNSAVRVLTLETLVADLQERLARLET